MRIFGRHRHLSPELLSGYLDQRLSAGQRGHVSRQLASCDVCREELESWRATVSLLQGLEDLPPPRSFTLAGPPPAPVAPREPLPLRAPGWVYAGATSVAGLALAVMVSADATGSLPGAPLTTQQESQSIATAPQAAATSEDAATAGDEQALPTAKPESAPEPETSESTRASQAPEADEGPEIAMAPPAPEADQTPTPEVAPFALEATPAPQGVAPDDGAQPESEQQRGEAGKPREDPDSQQAATEPATREDSAAEEEVPTSEPDQTPALRVIPEGTTTLVWRVLEGVAAALFLVLLAVLLFKRRLGAAKARRN